MSIDDRLRASLPAVLDELAPDVERSLALTLQRVDRRRGLRRGAYAVALVAAAAVAAAVVVRVDDGPRSLEPVDPPTNQVLVLDADEGSPDEPAPIAAATYAIGFLGASDTALWAEIEIPDGWSHDRLHPATGPDLDPHLRRIELFAVASVAPDPCRPALSTVGPGVSDLMEAIAAQQTVRPGLPRPATIDGYSGQVWCRCGCRWVSTSRRATARAWCRSGSTPSPDQRLPRLDIWCAPSTSGRATGHRRLPRPRRHARRTGRAHPDGPNPRVRPAPLPLPSLCAARPSPARSGLPLRCRFTKGTTMYARLLTRGVLATLVVGFLAACSPDAVPASPVADAAAPPRRGLDPELGSPDEPAALNPAATPSSSSAPPTTPPGRRSTCRRAGVTTGSTPPPGRTSTPTCAASSSSP